MCNRKTNPHSNQTAMGSFVDLLHGFYREVFGSFVPGAITASFFVLLPFLTFLSLSNNDIYVELKQLIGIGGKTVGNNTLFASALALLFLILSYAIGGILYRRAPKYVDAVASFRQWCFSSDEERQRLTVQFTGKTHGYKGKKQFRVYRKSLSSLKDVRGFFQHCLELFVDLPWGGGREDLIIHGNRTPISYPYPFLRPYLLRRGLTELARFVGWCDCPKNGNKNKASDNRDSRSKNTINVLKYRIRYYGSADMIHELDRNECNIRMLNSLWFSFRFVRTVIFLCLGALFINGLTTLRVNWEKIGIATAVLAVFSVPLWIISLLFKRHAKELLRQQKYVAWLLQSRSPCVLFSCELMVYGLYVISLDGHFWFATGLIWLLYAVTFCRRNIEKGFHYVRERELIYILSSVDILDGELRDEETFKDVKASTIKSAVKLCNKCANKAKCYGEEFKDITGEFLSQYNK